MKHLIISREYPPASYAPGGIGIYVATIARLLAERGETVHVIGQRWRGAPNRIERSCEGRLVVHRVGKDDPRPDAGSSWAADRFTRELDAVRQSSFPNQWFALQAAYLSERLIEVEGIDVIEGQDWEAPLYFLLLRRALGLGPTRRPPCIVHLHSPSELIFRYNGLPPASAYTRTIKRLEDYCIRAGDARLCPSHYLATDIERRFGLVPGSIEVIRLPVGPTEVLKRSPETWARGPVCFVGRLEPRKGVIEWVEAAARVAHDDPDLEFDFVGADNLRLWPALMRAVPRELRCRFRFHGSHPRTELPKFLRTARAAVVPSRWENFPNVCIEAMGSGLPVIATRLGGMAELLEDGRTGWLAPNRGVAGMVDGLDEALRRCLETSAEERARMGVHAAAAVQEHCNNERITAQHVEFRANVAGRGAERSLCLPAGDLALCLPSRRAQQPTPDNCGVIIAVDAATKALPVLESVQCQDERPRVIVVTAGSQPSAEVVRLLEGAGACLVSRPGCSRASAWNAGLALGREQARPGQWLFLDAHDRLWPDCLREVSAAAAARPEVGILSFWTGRPLGRGRPHVAPGPDLLYQTLGNDVVSASAFRDEAIGEATPFREGPAPGIALWMLANSMLAQGWMAATLPLMLAERVDRWSMAAWPWSTVSRAVRYEVLEPLREALGPQAAVLIDLQGDDPDAISRSLLPGLDKLGAAGRRCAWSLRHPMHEAMNGARRFRQLVLRASSLDRPAT